MFNTKTFSPWKADFRKGLTWLAVGGLIVGVAWMSLDGDLRLGVVGLGLFIGWLGLSRVQRGLVRQRGKAVEVRAAGQLRKALHPDIPMRESVMVATGGDADVVIDGDPRWVIEIKSHVAVQVERKWIGNDRVVHPKTKAPLKSVDGYLKQARRTARSLHGEPVLWFPEARRSSSGTIDGVRVVAGSAHHLLKHCGLPRA